MSSHHPPAALPAGPVSAPVGPASLPPAGTSTDGSAGSFDVAGVQQLLAALTESTDPDVVFASLIVALAPSLCDTASLATLPAASDPASVATSGSTGPSSSVVAASQAAVNGAAGIALRTVAPAPNLDEPASFTAVIEVTIESGSAARPDHAFRHQEGATTVPGSTTLVSCRWHAAPPSPERLLVVELMCRQAAALVLHARHRAALREQETGIYHLRRALTSNRTIAAAAGVLMATRKCTYEQAFELLLATSQRTNRKIIDLADEVLLTGQLMP